MTGMNHQAKNEQVPSDQKAVRLVDGRADEKGKREIMSTMPGLETPLAFFEWE